MGYNKLTIKIISAVIILVIPIILYGFNFNSIAFDRNLYKEEFSKHNVYANLKDDDIEKINDEVLDYLASKDNGLIENGFFNEREKMHLWDVKVLIQGFLSAYYFSIILFLSLTAILFLLMGFDFNHFSKKLLVILIFGSLLTFFEAVLIYLLPNLNFDFAFDAFHKTFFSPGTYLFNPEFENIVTLYPQNLFLDLLVRIIFGIIFSSGMLFFISAALFFIFFKRNFLNFSKNFPSGKPKKQKL